MKRRGMTLIELLVASSMSLIVIAGLVGTTLQFQAMSFRQQQRMEAQQSLRAASDVLTLNLQEAGAGLGNVRLSLGDGATRSAIEVVTADEFLADATFALPAAPYAGAASDSLVVYSGRSDGLRATACCGPGGGCGTCTIRSGGETCMASSPVGAIVEDDVVAYVNSTLGVACAQNVDAAPQQTRLMSSGGVAGFPAPSGSDPCGVTGQAWCSANTWVIPLRAVAFRVNWAPTVAGGPQRPRLQMDTDGPIGPAPWTDVLWDVEQLQVRLLVTNLVTPNAAQYFPDAAAGRIAIDQCTASTCAVPGGTDARDAAIATGLTADQAMRASLRRRVRGVEVTLLSRTISADVAQVQKQGNGEFVLTADGLPRDGLQRRRLTFQVTPRNFALTEAP